MLVFNMDGQEYGLQLENVAEILRMVAITPVPEANDTIEGVINLRGEVVPLLDLRKYLGLGVKPYTLKTHIIVARVRERTIGLVVDCATRVDTIPEEDIRSSQIVPHSKHLLGVAKVDGCLLLALDISSIWGEMQNSLAQKIDLPSSPTKSLPVLELITN